MPHFIGRKKRIFSQKVNSFFENGHLFLSIFENLGYFHEKKRAQTIMVSSQKFLCDVCYDKLFYFSKKTGSIFGHFSKKA
jgi:hypothetical protein